jgi:hypothetical protein
MLLVTFAGGRADARVAGHSCSATDRDFLSTAQLNLTAVNMLAQQYLAGEAKAADVIRETRDAAAVINGTKPTDRALEKTRRLLNAMFNEYARAIHAKSRERDAGRHIYRAYGLANFAREILADAQPVLATHGCDVAPLL